MFIALMYQKCCTLQRSMEAMVGKIVIILHAVMLVDGSLEQSVGEKKDNIVVVLWVQTNRSATDSNGTNLL